jgi:hypothetical protein
VWGLTKTDETWSTALETALTAARRDDLQHGTNAAYVHGCACKDCREHLRAVASETLTGMAGQSHRWRMNELLVGSARVSNEQQDLTSQRNGLHAHGVGGNRIYYVDHGLTGTNRDRPRLRLALAAAGLGTP